MILKFNYNKTVLSSGSPVFSIIKSLGVFFMQYRAAMITPGACSKSGNSCGQFFWVIGFFHSQCVLKYGLKL
jgi:hypothetical protein